MALGHNMGSDTKYKLRHAMILPDDFWPVQPGDVTVLCKPTQVVDNEGYAMVDDEALNVWWLELQK